MVQLRSTLSVGALVSVHSNAPVGVEGCSAFHLVADRHPLKGSEQRADQGLVLVDLRTRSMTQSRMPRVCVRRTAAGAPHRQELLHPQKTPSRGHKLRRRDDPGRVDGSCPHEGGGTWFRLASFRAFAKPLVSSPFGGSPYPAGVSSRGAIAKMQRTCHVVPDLPVSPICIGI